MTKILLALVATTCVVSGMSDIEVERLASAIWAAEGGHAAKVSHGILSVPVQNATHARQVCKRTILNSWGRFQAVGQPGDFVDFLARTYAPVPARNDPRGLNRHWPRNVRSCLRRLE